MKNLEEFFKLIDKNFLEAFGKQEQDIGCSGQVYEGYKIDKELLQIYSAFKSAIKNSRYVRQNN